MEILKRFKFFSRHIKDDSLCLKIFFLRTESPQRNARTNTSMKISFFLDFGVAKNMKFYMLVNV